MSVRARGNGVRRRRSWYRRRLRIRRACAVGTLILVVAFACWQNAAHLLHPSSSGAARSASDSFWGHAAVNQDLAWAPLHGKRAKYVARIPGVYPYSVIPGGLHSPEALRAAAAADRAVSRHYANFDYNKAHMIRLAEARDVYVSYRIRDTVFWTRKRIHLPVGEMLLTDGNITARAKCGNQISDTAKPEVSNEEPEEDVLDRAVEIDPLGPSLPIRPVLSAANLPTGQPLPPTIFTNGFVFPYAPFSGGLPVNICATKDGQMDKKCHPHKKPVAPEPSTMILLASGLAVVLWRYRASTRIPARSLAV